eukprot:UN19598
MSPSWMFLGTMARWREQKLLHSVDGTNGFGKDGFWAQTTFKRLACTESGLKPLLFSFYYSGMIIHYFLRANHLS